MADSLSGTTLGISPKEIFINSSDDEPSCEDIRLFSDYNGRLIGETKWKRDFHSRDIKDYTLKESQTNLDLNYSKKIYLSNREKTIKFCVKGEEGKYYGAILYRTEDNNAGVGSWITIQINEEVKRMQTIGLILSLVLLFFLLSLLVFIKFTSNRRS